MVKKLILIQSVSNVIILEISSSIGNGGFGEGESKF